LKFHISNIKLKISYFKLADRAHEIPGIRVSRLSVDARHHFAAHHEPLDNPGRRSGPDIAADIATLSASSTS